MKKTAPARPFINMVGNLVLVYIFSPSLYGVVSPYHQIGYGREMEKPPLACHKIIGIAATDTQVIGLEAQFR